MCRQQMSYEFRPVGDGGKTATTELFYREEVQLAHANRGMPLEGLRYDITPTGMHYQLFTSTFRLPTNPRGAFRSAAAWRIRSRWTSTTSDRSRGSPLR